MGFFIRKEKIMISCPSCGSHLVESLTVDVKLCQVCKTQFKVKNEQRIIVKQGMEVLID